MIEEIIQQHPFIFLGIIIWSLAWKGFALWRSARLNDKWWFVALLIINTMGILEIFYLFVFSRREIKEKSIENTRSEES